MEDRAWGIRHGTAEVLKSLTCSAVCWKGPYSCQAPSPCLIPAPSQMSQPSGHCTLRQLAAPQASAGQKLAAAHTPHTGCSQSLQKPTILKKCVDRTLTRKQGCCLCHVWFIPNPTHLWASGWAHAHPSSWLSWWREEGWTM